ncbi:transposase [Clostridium sp. CF011]|uniref:transposase n=1 Tax=Clostridium sp. CF011 TaxID=2843318 RepID=UPI001C0D79B5|nr:transposase [Clostridium sp. CF011]MBU3092860.1 transposase [Clostridium sp. CF011]WAG71097.1 transposase [Clostridium sp. CF011]
MLKKGIEKSDNTIELLGISIYITNIKEEVLSAEQIHEFYSLRWQVEFNNDLLIFNMA